LEPVQSERPEGQGTEESADARSAFSDSRVWLALWCVALFTAALLVNTRHNAFPYFYHPDEREKVTQLLTQNWNYHHPMLLLTATKAAADIAGVRPREQSMVEAGRWISASFTAVAVVALSLLGFAWRGWPAGITAGLALLPHHQFFELSHYLKEDTALLAGLSLTFLTAFAYWQKASAIRAAALGLSAALAISGKYLGVCGLAVALPVLWLAPGRRVVGLACFAGALLGALFVVNLPIVLHPAAFGQSFDRELDLAVHGQRGTTRNVPHALYWNIFRDNTTPVTWLLLLAFLAARWRERRSLTLAEWLLIAFPFVYALALSFSPKSNDRYFLPATAAFTLLAALGVLDAARLLSRWIPQRVGIAVLSLALVAAELPRWLRYERAFQRDDNRELFDWVMTQLPPDAVIAKDSRIRLPEPESPHIAEHFGSLPQTILAKKFAADFGSFAQMRERGITHVAVSESDYGRFFLKGLRPKKGEEKDFGRRKDFYGELLRDGDPLFERDRATVLYLHPGIRIYRLPPE
jgi:hypothetical protein